MRHFVSLSHVLNPGIALAILAQIVSLTDLFLLPEQKKSVEAWCDEITLRLDYARPVEWLHSWHRTSRRAAIAQVTFWLLFLSFSLTPLIIQLWRDSSLTSVVGLVFNLTLVNMIAGGLLRPFFRLNNFLSNKLVSTSNLAEFTIMFVLFTTFGAMVLAGGYLSFRRVTGINILHEYSSYILNAHMPGFNAHMPSPPKNPRVAFDFIFVLPTWPGLALFCLTGMFDVWFSLFIDGIITLCGASVIWMARAMLVVARSIMWRVALYPKGPLAALMLIVGGLFAIAKLYVTN
jgi:hypothetical protein